MFLFLQYIYKRINSTLMNICKAIIKCSLWEIRDVFIVRKSQLYLDDAVNKRGKLCWSSSERLSAMYLSEKITTVFDFIYKFDNFCAIIKYFVLKWICEHTFYFSCLSHLAWKSLSITDRFCLHRFKEKVWVTVLKVKLSYHHWEAACRPWNVRKPKEVRNGILQQQQI